jgi:peptidoglycan hydrolase CwlO-like protein
MVETIIVPIALALLTTLAAIYATRKQDRRLAEKQETDRAAQLNDMALELIEPYKREVAELRKELELMRCELDNERSKRRQLEQEVNQKNQTIAAMQVEIDDLRGQIEALQRKRQH